MINLSLGWPLILDTQFLRDAVKKAQEQGIIIVSASGNNNNDSLIFPCAYKGVICVGASTIDGTLANFTNYGGQVDVMAPGDNILSTYPLKFTPEYFSVDGYELKNGSSQATAYISAMMATLKGIFPEESTEQLKARLFSSTRKFGVNQTHRYTLNGIPNLQRAINFKGTSVIRPVFKEEDSIGININHPEFKLSIPLFNYGASSKNTKIAISFNNANISLDKDEFLIRNFPSSSEQVIEIKGRVLDVTLDNQLKLDLMITQNDQSMAYRKSYRLVRSINGKTISQNSYVIHTDNLSAAFKRKIKDFDKNLATIADPFSFNPWPSYYMTHVSKSRELSKLELIVFKKAGQEFSPLKPIILNNVIRFISLEYLDVNYDRVPDLMMRSLVQQGDTKFIQYSFFDQQGNELFGKYSHWKFIPETVVLNKKTLRYKPYHSKELGKIAIPLFLDSGHVPQLDVNPDPWDETPRNKSMHFYYLEPQLGPEGEMELKTRIVDNHLWIDQLREDLGLEWDDSIDFSHLLPQNSINFYDSTNYAIVSAGKNFSTKSFKIDLNAKVSRPLMLRTPRAHLEGTFHLPIHSIKNNKVNFNSGSLFFGQESDVILRLNKMSSNNSTTISAPVIYQHQDLRDHLLGVIASYQVDRQKIDFFQSKDYLLILSQGHNGRRLVYKRPIKRFSFLPGSLYNEVYFPITQKVENSIRPALYIDATQIARREVYLLTVDNLGKPISPINKNIKVPDNCNALNPAPTGSSGDLAFTFICRTGQNWSLFFTR